MQGLGAGLAKPEEFIYFSGAAVPFEYQTYGACWPLRRMRDTWREQEHLAFADVYDFGLALLVDDFDLDIAFELIKQLFAFFPMVVFAAIGATDDHDDEVRIFDIDLLIGDRGLEQMAVLFDPPAQIEWLEHKLM